jgi:hypothetical protein
MADCPRLRRAYPPYALLIFKCHAPAALDRKLRDHKIHVSVGRLREDDPRH